MKLALLCLCWGSVLMAVLATPTGAQQLSLPPGAESDRLQISGVYPHLTAYGIYSQNGAHLKTGHDECGIGAVVPWGGKLWMVNYAPHQPRGSEHKLYSIDHKLNLNVHPESVGGTPAGRMIHHESKQLFIAHYAIGEDGTVRVIPIEKMPIRVTAITRHLVDPENLVYYVDMEGSIWEANVHSLEVKQLFKKPVPGWHGKGAYVSQGRLVVSNNGELHAGSYNDLLVGGKAKDDEERGVLAQFDGKDWSIVERRQYTEVTGPSGIRGGNDGDEPIWSIGWDRRSLRLKVLDGGVWGTYLLPKAAFCNDAYHGWYTEWPRIREITGGRWIMDMHGMFFDFPKSFSLSQTAGIRPIGSHLRYIPDFCHWNGEVVLASDETSIQGNPLAGQPQTNLWFGSYEDLKSWGPASGYGGPWVGDQVTANQPSDPFLVSGFDHRVLHLAVGKKSVSQPEGINRASDQQRIVEISSQLVDLPRVTMNRGDWKKPAPGFEFEVNQPVTVFLAVDKRGEPEIAANWKLTEMRVVWGDAGHQDRIYQAEFPAGRIVIAGNSAEHIPGSFGMPHAAFVRSKVPGLTIASATAAVTIPKSASPVDPANTAPVIFTLEIDAAGTGQWTQYAQVEVPADGYASHLFASHFNATWLRLSASRDCTATAMLHQTTAQFHSGDDHQQLFAGIAAASENAIQAALVYPAKLSRNLSVLDTKGNQFDFTKEGFEFIPVDRDPKLAELLAVEPEFSVDEASVIVNHQGQRLRLPKGHAAFDQPFAFGYPRGLREVQSERHLANFHGTFYEVPLVLNGKPPALNLMRPVSSHNQQISDFCSWNGLLVLAGVSLEKPLNTTSSSEHLFASAQQGIGLWFGGIDDLWKLGKPVGKGGPWKSTAVKAGEPSDAYLMTGYDQKTLTLEADADTSIGVEVDVDHQTGWHHYLTLDVKAGQVKTYLFPRGYSAHWVRLISSREAKVTAQFSYE